MWSGLRTAVFNGCVYYRIRAATRALAKGMREAVAKWGAFQCGTRQPEASKHRSGQSFRQKVTSLRPALRRSWSTTWWRISTPWSTCCAKKAATFSRRGSDRKHQRKQDQGAEHDQRPVRTSFQTFVPAIMYNSPAPSFPNEFVNGSDTSGHDRNSFARPFTNWKLRSQPRQKSAYR